MLGLSVWARGMLGCLFQSIGGNLKNNNNLLFNFNFNLSIVLPT